MNRTQKKFSQTCLPELQRRHDLPAGALTKVGSRKEISAKLRVKLCETPRENINILTLNMLNLIGREKELFTQDINQHEKTRQSTSPPLKLRRMNLKAAAAVSRM